MRLAEQTGYRLYDKNGIEINCPMTTVQGLIKIAEHISGNKLFAKVLSEKEIVLFESLSDVAKKNIDRDKIVYRIYGEYKSCCSH